MAGDVCEQTMLFGNWSHVGLVRETNEDHFGRFNQGKRNLLVVADGMGGEVGGREASTRAVNAVHEYFSANSEEVPHELLTNAVQEANKAILLAQKEKPELSGMGTTLDLVLLEGRMTWFAHVGDSRIYLLSKGKGKQLTKDHTLVQQMLDGNLLSPEEAKEHPQRHILNRVLGKGPNPEPDISVEPIQLMEGDSLLMCTDGLSDSITPEEMASAAEKLGPQKACRRLVNMANNRGGRDNCTVQIVYAGVPQKNWIRYKTILDKFGSFEINTNRHRYLNTRIGFLFIVILLIGGFALWWGMKTEGIISGPEKPKKQVIQSEKSATATKEETDQLGVDIKKTSKIPERKTNNKEINDTCP